MTTENVEATDLLKAADLTGCENSVTLTEWVEQHLDTEGYCAPCEFSVIAPWYRDVLQKGGESELAARVDALADSDQDPMHIAEVLDSVKADVQNEVIKSNLTLFDCMLQKYSDQQEVEPDGS